MNGSLCSLRRVTDYPREPERPGATGDETLASAANVAELIEVPRAKPTPETSAAIPHSIVSGCLGTVAGRVMPLERLAQLEPWPFPLGMPVRLRVESAA